MSGSYLSLRPLIVHISWWIVDGDVGVDRPSLIVISIVIPRRRVITIIWVPIVSIPLVPIKVGIPIAVPVVIVAVVVRISRAVRVGISVVGIPASIVSVSVISVVPIEITIVRVPIRRVAIGVAVIVVPSVLIVVVPVTRTMLLIVTVSIVVVNP